MQVIQEYVMEDKDLENASCLNSTDLIRCTDADT